MKILELIDVSSFYGEAQAIFDVSLTVNEGECLVLLGRNGAGKTTTMRSIMRLTPPRSGSISYRGVSLEGMGSHQIARMGIGYVPEDRRIFPGLTVEQNLVLGTKLGRDKKAVWDIERIYKILPKLWDLKARNGDLLSGGEQQMLTIGRSLMGNPDLLLLDEPTEGLAPIIVQELAATIRQIKSEGMTIVLVEQNVEVALSLADRCYVYDHGQIVDGGDPQAVLGDSVRRQELLGV